MQTISKAVVYGVFFLFVLILQSFLCLLHLSRQGGEGKRSGGEIALFLSFWNSITFAKLFFADLWSVLQNLQSSPHPPPPPHQASLLNGVFSLVLLVPAEFPTADLSPWYPEILPRCTVPKKRSKQTGKTTQNTPEKCLQPPPLTTCFCKYMFTTTRQIFFLKKNDDKLWWHSG